jgi:hypothetical protein
MTAIIDITNFNSDNLKDLILNETASRATKKSVVEAIQDFNARHNVEMRLTTAIQVINTRTRREEREMMAIEVDGYVSMARTKKSQWGDLTRAIAAAEESYRYPCYLKAEEPQPQEASPDIITMEEIWSWFE